MHGSQGSGWGSVRVNTHYGWIIQGHKADSGGLGWVKASEGDPKLENKARQRMVFGGGGGEPGEGVNKKPPTSCQQTFITSCTDYSHVCVELVFVQMESIKCS